MNKNKALEHAIEIAKETARSGNTINASSVVEDAYNKIIEIAEKEGMLSDGMKTKTYV